MLKADAKQLAVLGSVLVVVAAAAGCSDENKTPSVDPTLAAQGKDIFRTTRSATRRSGPTR